MLALTVSLLLAQVDLAAPVCLDARLSKAIQAPRTDLFRSVTNLKAILDSERQDIQSDRVAAQGTFDSVITLLSDLGHLADLVDLGTMSSEKKVRIYARRLIFTALRITRNSLSGLKETLGRFLAYTTLPALVMESREISRVLEQIEAALDPCVQASALPA